MRKKKKQGCGCQSKCDDYNICNEKVKPVNACKANSMCKKPSKKYVDCGYKNEKHNCGCEEKYEVTCVDKCLELSNKAEDLFKKALDCECKAKDAYDKAKECEKSSKVLSAKAKDLMDEAECSEKGAKKAECKAKDLMEKSKALCERAKCLYKEAENTEDKAKDNCEKAKDLYEKAQEYNEQAKCLYDKALQCDEKALQCYKNAEEKIKEYEHKSKKCEDMIKKCSNKLNEPPMDVKGVHDNKECTCNKNKYCYIECEEYKEKNMYDDCDKATYVSPMYDMCNMYYVGGMSQEYPMVDMPYMNPYCHQCQDANDMWMYYYMNMKNMMKNMNYNKY